MPQKVKGFLAADGSFHESEAECDRYECILQIRALCESHNVNPENFFELLHEWGEHIKGYYDADSKCKQRQAVAKGRVEFPDADDLPHAESDNADYVVGDKDAPGFLEQQIRRNK